MKEEVRGTPIRGDDDSTLYSDDGQDHCDWSILSLLLAHEAHAGLWSVEELGRMLQDHVAVIDAVGRLLRDGLINQQGSFVFPTRAATRFNEIVE